MIISSSGSLNAWLPVAKLSRTKAPPASLAKLLAAYGVILNAFVFKFLRVEKISSVKYYRLAKLAFNLIQIGRFEGLPFGNDD